MTHVFLRFSGLFGARPSTYGRGQGREKDNKGRPLGVLQNFVCGGGAATVAPVRTADCDCTAGCVTIRGITFTPTPTLTPTLTPFVTATKGFPYV